jgi:RND family efflux transporter MFP subunit
MSQPQAAKILMSIGQFLDSFSLSYMGRSVAFLSRLGCSVTLSVAFVMMAASCSEGQKPATPAPPAVTVVKPIVRTITDYDEYVGRFAAVNSVEVRARVSGYLDGVHFKDGQLVKQGDLLFTIDKRPFQNTLDQARANSALAKSNLTYTQSDLVRGQQLVRDKTITEQTFEQRSQAFRNAEASVSNAAAALKQAELDLEFTELRAPIDGRIGDRRVSPGNLVTGGTTGNTTLLATIVSTDPIYFEFTFDEASYLHYERLAKTGKDVASRGASVPVALKLMDEKDFDHEGRMDFVDNVIDRSTGTIRGRAVVRDPNKLFTPGLFARVRVPASPPYETLLVPDSAIGTEQQRKYVLVVADNNTVVSKYVTLGQIVENDMQAIKNGIDPGDRVIVKGLLRTRPGQKVNPQNQTASMRPLPGPNLQQNSP